MNDFLTVAIILAGGRGSRLSSVTSPFLKPILPINGVPVFIYSVIAAISYVNKIIIVANPVNSDKIAKIVFNTFKAEDNQKNIMITIQPEPRGVADAINIGLNSLTKDQKLVVLCGDNIYENKNVKTVIDCINKNDSIKLGWTYKKFKPQIASRFAVWSPKSSETGILIEKPRNPPSQICWCGPLAFRSSHDVKKRISNLKLSSRNEYEVTDLLNTYLINGEHRKIPLEGIWFDIGTSNSFKDAQHKMNNMEIRL